MCALSPYDDDVVVIPSPSARLEGPRYCSASGGGILVILVLSKQVLSEDSTQLV